MNRYHSLFATKEIGAVKVIESLERLQSDLSKGSANSADYSATKAWRMELWLYTPLSCWLGIA